MKNLNPLKTRAKGVYFACLIDLSSLNFFLDKTPAKAKVLNAMKGIF